MESPEPFLIFTRKLNELAVPYMVSGSVAAIFYGEPRMTNDVDIIVVLKGTDITRLERAFPEDEFYCPPTEVIRLETSRDQRGHFNIIHLATGFKADLYVSGKDDLHAWGLAHIRTVELGEDSVQLAPPEYVIVRKLEFYREGKSEKHLRDISRMLVALGDTWNRGKLLSLVAQRGLEIEWKSATKLE